MSVADLTRMDGTCNSCVLPLVEDDCDDYSTGVTSLMHAAYKGNVQCVKELIAAGADVNAEDENGSTPLIYAACSDTCSEACVQTLLDERADVNACNTYCDTALL